MKKFECEYVEFENMSLTTRQHLIQQWSVEVDAELAVIREKAAQLKALAEAQSKQTEWPH